MRAVRAAKKLGAKRVKVCADGSIDIVLAEDSVEALMPIPSAAKSCARRQVAVVMDMPKPRKPNLVRQVTQHGTVVWYYRRGHGERVRLRGAYGSPEFLAAYDAAAQGKRVEPLVPTGASRARSDGLSSSTRARARGRPSSPRRASSARRSFAASSPRRPTSTTPRLPARMWSRAVTPPRRRPPKPTSCSKVIRCLFDWAIEAGYMEINPAKDVPFLKVEGDGFHAWTDEELDRFEATYPLGTRERLAYAVLIYTGQRRGDVVEDGPPARQGRRPDDPAGEDWDGGPSTDPEALVRKPLPPGRPATLRSSLASMGVRW